LRAVDAFNEFVFQLAIIHEDEDWSKYICPTMGQHKDKLVSFITKTRELTKKDTTIKLDEKNNTVYFDGQDITSEI